MLSPGSSASLNRGSLDISRVSPLESTVRHTHLSPLEWRSETYTQQLVSTQCTVFMSHHMAKATAYQMAQGLKALLDHIRCRRRSRCNLPLASHRTVEWKDMLVLHDGDRENLMPHLGYLLARTCGLFPSFGETISSRHKRGGLNASPEKPAGDWRGHAGAESRVEQRMPTFKFRVNTLEKFRLEHDPGTRPSRLDNQERTCCSLMSAFTCYYSK